MMIRQLGTELLLATEEAAVAASRHVGRGDKLAADEAATHAMRSALNDVDFAARVAIGEGEKDGAPGLFAGELVGARSSPASCCDRPEFFDLAVDPVDGTTQVAKGGYEAMSILAVAEECSLFATKSYYMMKLAWGPRLEDFPGWLVDEKGPDIPATIREAASLCPGGFRVCVLDRPRHEKLVRVIREAGGQIKFIQDCDVSGVIATATPENAADLYVGVGGATEGVLGAAAIKCLGGRFQGILCDKDGTKFEGEILDAEDLAGGEVSVVITGVTDGGLLRGVRKIGDRITTHSVVLHSHPRTVRWINTERGI